jgi:sulfoxide reductase catalytic subunit YedY
MEIEHIMMLIKQATDIREHEVTDHDTYLSRRHFIKAGLGGLSLLGLGLSSEAKSKDKNYILDGDQANSYKDITSYNNFYEFGTGKGDPAKNAHSLQTSPWSIAVEGECEKPGHYTLEDILKPHDIEERLYRFRCVEGWSMVIPWQGFQLSALIKRLQPTSKAKYVQFETLYDPKHMPGQRRPVLDWPYVEGLRMDEAMHPLTILATGIYGEELPKQNGAPLRLVAPWKYGFKNIKSIAKIHFVEKQPISAWTKSIPEEYGFYSNVNPKVSHPRWSQKRERRIGEFFKRDTLMFNGYADQVASLYSGMDLKKFF